MERRELEEIERFLQGVGKPSLYTYLGVSPEDEVQDVDSALRRKRSWAQAQQANPRFRDEAQFVMRHYGLLHRVMIEDADAWRLHVHDGLISRAIDQIAEMARSMVSNGFLSAASETEVMERARVLGLDLDIVRWRVDDALGDIGARRASTGDRNSESSVLLPTDDYYARLGVAPDASDEAIEDAYNIVSARAALVPDPVASAHARHAVDEAFEVLSDPERRAAYDQTRDQMAATAEEATRRASLVSSLRRADPLAPAVVRDEPVRGAPRPTPQLVVRERSLDLRVADVPVRRTLRIQNDGRGRMPGWVRTDAEWLRVPRPRLDPNAAQQDVDVEIDPVTMPLGTSRSMLVVDTDHGQQVIIDVVVRRLPLRRLARYGALGLMALAALGTGTWKAWRHHADNQPGTLVLDVDPAARSVLVDGVGAGAGRHIVLTQPRVGERFHVRIEADGFEPHEELVWLRRGMRRSRSVQLTLATPLDEEPGDGETIVRPSPSGQRALEDADAYETCRGDVARALELDAWVGRQGDLRGLRIRSREPEGVALPGEVEGCIRRAVRAIPLPRTEGWWSHGWTLRLEARR
ncbi:MAG: DnaJ domain [Pseudomonadota bacterium]